MGSTPAAFRAGYKPKKILIPAEKVYLIAWTRKIRKSVRARAPRRGPMEVLVTTEDISISR